VDGFFFELRHAFRGLSKRPSFTAVAVLTLALGVGAATTMFSVLHGVVLRPLDFRSPDELVFVHESSPDGAQTYSVSIPNFFDWRERNRSFDALAAFRAGSFNLTGGAEPLRVRSAMVSSNFFETLGVSPALGRSFDGEESVVLSRPFWRTRFEAREDVIGASVVLDGRSFTVAGVLPEDFEFLTSTVELFAPMEAFRSELPWNDRESHPALWVVGRLAPGTSLSEARADLERLAREIDAEHGHPHAVALGSLHDRSVSRSRESLFALNGGVALLLLVSCANVANLLLARASSRGREMATRAALGAGRGRLVVQLWTESLLFTSLGGALGLLGASWGVDFVKALLPASTPRLARVGLDFDVLGFALVVSLVAGLAFGLAPIAGTWRYRMTSELRAAQGIVSSRRGLARSLVVVEVALAVVLLSGTGLFVKSFLALSRIDAGFRTADRVAARVALAPGKYDNAARRADFYDRVLDDLRSRPGVRSAAAATGLPLVAAGTEAGVAPEGERGADFEDEILASVQLVSSDYFETMGIELLRGRAFDSRDRASSGRVAVVDETLERRLFGGGSALGKRLSLGGTPEAPNFTEIVGVVRHVLNYQLTAPQYAEVYVPMSQPTDWASEGLLEGNVIVRHSGRAEDAIRAVREVVLSIDPAQPVYGTTTLEDVVALALAPQRTSGVLSAGFAGAALVLSAIGLYGVLSGIVELRKREIGLRIALGATPSRMLRAVVGSGMTLVALGVAMGLGASFALSRAVASLVFHAQPLDPDVLFLVLAFTSGASLLACWIPAARAARTEPVDALRCD
jgi:predicted permease